MRASTRHSACAVAVSSTLGWRNREACGAVAGQDPRRRGARAPGGDGLRRQRADHATRSAYRTPESGETVPVTHEEILEHVLADHGALEAAERFTGRQIRWHGRLIRALRPYGDRIKSVDSGIVRDPRGPAGLCRAHRSGPSVPVTRSWSS
jgi:hypothetical protein